MRSRLARICRRFSEALAPGPCIELDAFHRHRTIMLSKIRLSDRNLGLLVTWRQYECSPDQHDEAPRYFGAPCL